jgi:hypothetical protein
VACLLPVGREAALAASPPLEREHLLKNMLRTAAAAGLVRWQQQQLGWCRHRVNRRRRLRPSHRLGSRWALPLPRALWLASSPRPFLVCFARTAQCTFAELPASFAAPAAALVSLVTIITVEPTAVHKCAAAVCPPWSCRAVRWGSGPNRTATRRGRWCPTPSPSGAAQQTQPTSVWQPPRTTRCCSRVSAAWLCRALCSGVEAHACMLGRPDLQQATVHWCCPTCPPPPNTAEQQAANLVGRLLAACLASA